MATKLLPPASGHKPLNFVGTDAHAAGFGTVRAIPDQAIGAVVLLLVPEDPSLRTYRLNLEPKTAAELAQQLFVSALETVHSATAGRGAE